MYDKNKEVQCIQWKSFNFSDSITKTLSQPYMLKLNTNTVYITHWNPNKLPFTSTLKEVYPDYRWTLDKSFYSVSWQNEKVDKSFLSLALRLK